MLKNKGVISFLLIVCLILSSMATIYAANAIPTATASTTANSTETTFTDVKGHWAQAAVERFYREGVISGSGDKFYPQSNITRGDFAVILTKLLGYTDTSKENFSDLKEGAYYSSPVLKLNYAGVMEGYGGRIRPTQNVTRQEAAVMICRALDISPEETRKTAFDDESTIAAWAKGYVFALVNQGILRGSQNKLNPRSALTRAEICAILNNAIPETGAVQPENGITLTANIKTNAVVKSSHFTLELVVTLNGEKIPQENVVVSLNANCVNPTWDDSVKTSYELKMAEGKNRLIITTAAGEAKRRDVFIIDHTAAKEGDVVGQAVLCLEALTLGSGYLITPETVDIREGENSAQLLVRWLEDHGYSYKNTGKTESGFYLSAIDGGKIAEIVPSDAKAVTVPAALKKILDKGNVVLTDRTGSSLGEFDYTSMSGWMYSVNNKFPNVGFSNTYLQDGDVVRVQFTLCGYGADLGGAYSVGGSATTDYYKTANKTELLKKVAEVGYNKTPDSVRKVLIALDAEQEAVNKALRQF